MDSPQSITTRRALTLASISCIALIAAWHIMFLPASAQVSVTANVPGVCGNGVVEPGEQCDAGGSNGSCPAACSGSCTTNSCGGGGGGGGGGGSAAPVAVTQAVFSGKAYPGSTVTILKDAQIAATTIAGVDASFSFAMSGLSGGMYLFSMYSEDRQGRRSSLLTFPVAVTSGTTANVGGIFVAPTIGVDKIEVRRGDVIAFLGQSAPQADITLMVSSEEEFFVRTAADKDGAYLARFDTAPLEYGKHGAKARATLGAELVSGFGQFVNFTVGTKTVLAPAPTAPLKGDINSDRRVNLVDFSIAAYWYRRSVPPAQADLNGDGKVDLVDFSIMAFYWTG